MNAADLAALNPLPRVLVAVVALETLPLGDPFAATLTIAEADANAAAAAAIATLFPAELTPTTADAIAEYTWRTGRLGPAGYGERLAEIHHLALASHPELARMLRSRDAIADVETAASQTAHSAHHLETHAAAAAVAAAAARRRYQLAIAVAIADLPDHQLHVAAVSLLAADALMARCSVERARREQHAKAELERVEADRRAAAREASRAVIDRVRAAAAQAEDARVKALLSAEEYRKVRADALIDRLRLSGLKELRVGRTDGPIFVVDNLIGTARGLSLESLGLYEAALAAVERV